VEPEAFLASLEQRAGESEIRLGVAWLDDTLVAVSALDSELEKDVRGIALKAARRLKRQGDQPFQPGGDLSRGSFGRMTLEAATKSGLLHGALSASLDQLQDFGTADPINLEKLQGELPSFYAFVCQPSDGKIILFGRRLTRSPVWLVK